MHVNVTRKEIEESAELLELLKRWEDVTLAREDYSRGVVSIKTVDVEVSVNIRRSHERPSVDQQISDVVGLAMIKAANQVCEIIRNAMPIKVTE